MFSAVLTAYNNHWKLRTSPDDWWFCVIKRVAGAIDKNAKKESIRKMFVDHEGKKTIEVKVPDSIIYTVDYSWFFDQIAKGNTTERQSTRVRGWNDSGFQHHNCSAEDRFADYID
ncbi:hypothetical protein OS493_007282 [Desmophyllum pertusum]|uniref:Uncharacterized protein n=1 Tax=Desmophyllum pertusum TaxID=174260 RepID=A0A9W9Z4G1_9CNID|nr:hypothetical protein OS493_007282 [Desmophyllum pertusum]